MIAARSALSAMGRLADGGLYEYQTDEANALRYNDGGLFFRSCDALSRTWDLGIIAFGGPPVLFQIVHARFVDVHGGKVAWLDEQTVRLLYTC